MEFLHKVAKKINPEKREIKVGQNTKFSQDREIYNNINREHKSHTVEEQSLK